ncbi:hypothetical protein DSL72_009001 [Monilinia vaccinii-corymbosi]|uniref:Urease accessory protein UreD n=1 Tax=Monilinia vaccinii-corymbosi TaxID=61207 RepID=A0A8A3PPW7_9HELO|nr:hypothetical protein DSL72_009001 [Monilinia vaccinii-corymbosi]
MPHKHTRKAGEDKSTIDLPPTTIAKPLPVSKSSSANGIFTSESNATRKNKKRKRNANADDDTPKAFARLMAFKSGQRLPKGLDDGVKKPKNKKSTSNDAGSEERDLPTGKEDSAMEIPKIRPGEKMWEFSARVDAALPVGGLIHKSARGGKDPLVLKKTRTKTEKKMHRMYDEWREEEKKIQQRRQEEAELREEDDMEMDGDGQMQWKSDITALGNTEKNKKKMKKKKKKKVLGEIDDGNDDPWAIIAKNRGEVKVGLNDVVQAPPTFTKVPKAKFKELQGAKVEVSDVPRAAGSLRRREELGEVRKGIVESYRQMMKDHKDEVKSQ